MNIKTITKIILSFILLSVLFHEVHLKEMLPYFKKMSLSYLSLSTGLVFLSIVIGIARWILVMATLQAPKAPIFYIKAYFKGVTFNQVLPSSIGGDGYRMIEITKLGITKRLAITGVLSDRIFGFAGLLLPALLFLPITYHLLPFQVFLITSLIVITSSLSIVGLTCLSLIQIKLLEKHLRWLYDLSNTLRASAHSTLDLIYKLILSIITNMLNSISFYCIALSLGIPGHLMGFIIIIPLVTLIMMIPISMAGWGIREGAMVFFGGVIGISHPAALAISLLSGLVLIVNSLPGLYLYVVDSIREHKEWGVRDSNAGPTG